MAGHPESELFHEEPAASDLTSLVADAVAGDQLAWNSIVERFSGTLWSICRGYRLSPADASDAFQMTWLRLLEHIGSIRDPERLRFWLATTCRNECLSLLRRGKRTRPTGDDYLFDLVGGEPAPSADLPTLVSSRDGGLWRAFSQLSDRCQQILRVLVANAEDGPPRYELAAKALGIPIGSLGPSRKRCLSHLRKLLDKEGISGYSADS